jgi:hypothetical protein
MNSLLKKYGPTFLLFSKFVPGLGMLVPPITGAMRVKVWYFLLLDAGGALAWASAYVLFGRVLCPHLDYLRISSTSSNLVFGLAGLAMAALGWGTIQLRPSRMWGKLRQRCSVLYADIGRFRLMLSPAVPSRRTFPTGISNEVRKERLGGDLPGNAERLSV